MACMRWTQSRLSSSCDEFQGIRRNFIKGTAAPFSILLYTALDYVYCFTVYMPCRLQELTVLILMTWLH